MMQMMIRVCLLSSIFASCTHLPFFSGQDNKVAKQSNKPIKESKVQTASPQNSNTLSSCPEVVPTPLEEISLYMRVSDLQTNMTLADIQSLRKVASTLERSPMNRASLLFGILRAFTHQGIDAVLIDQAGLTERTPIQIQNWSNYTSLDSLLSDSGFSFKRELDANPFLQNYIFADLALRAAYQNQDTSSSSVTEMKTAVKEKAAQWANLYDKMNNITHPMMPSTTPQATSSTEPSQPPAIAALPALPVVENPPPSSTPQGEINQNNTSNPISNNPTLMDPEADLLRNANELVEKNQFKNAITMLKRIDATSKFYQDVKVRIKIISNKAVSDLRTKAARSYQSAIPITDLKVRATYLTEARNFLVRAVEDYPDSDQLEAVKQNLATIDKSLQVMKN